MKTYEENLLSFKKQLNFDNLIILNTFKIKNKKIDGLVIIGMGGSGLAGDLLLEFFGKSLKIPIIVWKNYGLPENKFKNPLFVFVSFSGNTEETISGLKILIKRGWKNNLAIITTGGEMKKMGQKYGLKLISFNAPNLTPREALGYTYFSLIKLLKDYITIKISNLELIPKIAQKKAKKNK